MRFDTTTKATVGTAVANLLSLPVTSSTGPSLSDYKNSFVYVNSFNTSQREILNAVQKSTDTTDSDWNISHKSGQAYIDEGSAMLKQGDMYGMINILYGHHFVEGLGGNFSTSRKVANEALGLSKEDLEETTKRIVESVA